MIFSKSFLCFRYVRFAAHLADSVFHQTYAGPVAAQDPFLEIDVGFVRRLHPFFKSVAAEVAVRAKPYDIFAAGLTWNGFDLDCTFVAEHRSPCLNDFYDLAILKFDINRVFIIR